MPSRYNNIYVYSKNLRILKKFLEKTCTKKYKYVNMAVSKILNIINFCEANLNSVQVITLKGMV